MNTLKALDERLTRRGWRLATAESCTGGRIAARVTACSGASAWYAGGVVAYANTAKTALLGVPETLLARHGAVSAPVAEAMATGALDRLGADAAIATTGIAGPGGGSPEKPVGLVYIAVATRGAPPRVSAVRLSGSRRQIQMIASQTALKMLYTAIQDAIKPGGHIPMD